MSFSQMVFRADAGQIQAELRRTRWGKKRMRIFAALFAKSVVTVAFCVAFVSGSTLLLGAENAIVGVVILLALLTFQKVHLGYKNSHGAFALFVIFVVFAVVPPIVVGAPMWVGCLLNIAALGFILVAGCDRVEFQNHIVLVLSYLLLLGYPVTGKAQTVRIIALILGGVWAASIMMRRNRHNDSQRGFIDALRDLGVQRASTRWKLELTLIVPLAMAVGAGIGLQRPMWIGIAAMSVLTPSRHHNTLKMVQRLTGTLLGVLLFALIMLIPGVKPVYVGLIGGLAVGLSASYRYQTIFNSMAALSVAMAIIGPEGALVGRVADNLFGIGFVLVAVFLMDWGIRVIFAVHRRSQQIATLRRQVH